MQPIWSVPDLHLYSMGYIPCQLGCSCRRLRAEPPYRPARPRSTQTSSLYALISVMRTTSTGERRSCSAWPRCPGSPPSSRYASAARGRAPYFAYRLRAGAGRRSGSGWRQGRVRWGRPLLSQPLVSRGERSAGSAAVQSAAVSAVAWSCGCVVGFGWL